MFLAVGYVGGYLGLARDFSSSGATVHRYDSQFAFRIYQPLGWLESRIRRRPVMLDLSLARDAHGGEKYRRKTYNPF
jgi:hypothetical protein